MTDVEQVSAAEVLSQGGADQPVLPYTYLQITGVRLALAVGGLAAFIVVSLLVYWICTVPPALTPPAGSDPDKLRQLVELQKQLQDAHLEPVLKIFDNLVVKCLLPLLTTILGYIFGSQTHRK